MGPKAVVGALACLALGLSPAVLGARIFQNSGTLSGWDGQEIDRDTKGKLEQVTNVVLKGSSAIKSTQTYLGESYEGRYHAELYRNDGYRPGDTRYYGLAFRLSQDWEFADQSYSLAQFIADFSDTVKPECDTWMPSTMVWLQGRTLKTRARSGELSGSRCVKDTKSFDVGTVEAGRWHRLVLGVSWRADGKGFLRAWLDDVQTVDQSGISTTVVDPKNRAFKFRVGLYANGWHDNDHRMKGSQGFRQVWYDEIAIGTTEADVKPGSW